MEVYMSSQVNFFNSVAHKWDSMIVVNEEKINYALDRTGLSEESSILDVGTGTGVMIPFLLNRIGLKGKITAVDIAENMLDVAKEKFQGEDRIEFLNINIEEEKVEETFDLIICYSVFPHFTNKTETIKKLIDNNLKKDGKLLIFHSQSKEKINSIHQKTDAVVAEDKLIDLDRQKKLFKNEGMKVSMGIDNEEMYLIIIEK